MQPHERLIAFDLVRLAAGDIEGQRVAFGVRAEVDLGREAAARAPERFVVLIPPFTPAACWCARCTVQRWTSMSLQSAARAFSRPVAPSTITSSGVFRPRLTRLSRSARQVASLSPPMLLTASRTFWPSCRTPRIMSSQRASRCLRLCAPLHATDTRTCSRKAWT